MVAESACSIRTIKTVKLLVLSDLHIEFEQIGYDFSKCDVVVLAGDIHVGTRGVQWALENIKDKPVIYVLGNHEYYRCSYPKLLHLCKEVAVGSNVHVLENESITIEDVTFHGATLWTDFNLFGDPLKSGIEAQAWMNDYKLIRKNPSYGRITPLDTAKIHKGSTDWLLANLQDRTTTKNIVITHHAPSLKSVSAQYKKDKLTPSFASDLENIITKCKPDLWIHGHIHSACDYLIANTRVVCNPFGYPHEKTIGFDPSLIVDV